MPAENATENRRRPQPLSERYAEEDRGHETPCWGWTGTKCGTEYGKVHRRGRGVIAAHRASYEERHNCCVLPWPKVHLDHLCGVRACINPDHLEPVTPAENVRRGKLAKLNWDAVEAIRHEYAEAIPPGKVRAKRGTTQRLAERYGVTRHTISSVVARRVWA